MSAPAPNLSSKSSFGQTLQFITNIKLQELEKQRILYQEHAKVVEEANALGASGNVLKQVEILAKAAKSWTGSGGLAQTQTVGGSLNLHELDFWIQQARKDPSFSMEIAEGWARTLEDHIRHNATRFDAAKLFGSLFNEWLASGDSAALAYQAGPDDAESVLSEDKFVEIGRKDMHEQKAKLQSIIFQEAAVDVKALKDYLHALFQSEEASVQALDALRKELKAFGHLLRRKVFTAVDVKHAIDGLLASGLMDEEKRTTLKAFKENQAVIDEVASVLTMRIASLDTWEWPEEGMLVEFRRHLNGKYRAFTDPEIVDALLLHHIGVAWQVALKNALSRLFDSKAWIRPIIPLSVVERLRGQINTGGDTVNKHRDDLRRKHFFMAQLQSNASSPKPYDDLVDAPAQKNPDVLSPAVIKQKLLQIMTTECYLNTTIHGSHAAICSDLAWFGPSLPHASILTILEFLGMSKSWLRFYSSFLGAPIRFPGELEPRVRKRGTPISYSLSVLCGEAVMFIMDFAVNRRANGLHLYRMHDDLWLWDSDVSKVAAGWAEMQKYASHVGLTFNESKTGSAYIGPANEMSRHLPAGDIHWGFLRFDPALKRFRLDQNEVDHHIVEMRRQLASTKSVFGWVNAYNKYMAFFFRNFGGTPTRCFGQEHITELIDTLARIQRELFPPSPGHGTGGAVGYLRKILEERFQVTDLPEGYFYFPIGSGGLELHNTMLELLALEQGGRPYTAFEQTTSEGDVVTAKNTNISQMEVDSDSEDLPGPVPIPLPPVFPEFNARADQKFTSCMQQDVKAYERSKESFEVKELRRSFQVTRKQAAYETFMSFEEYTSLRESWLPHWGYSYQDMLKAPHYVQVALPQKLGSGPASWSWPQMSWYEKWVVSMYGEGVVKKFGGVKAVDPALIPVGMVELFRTSRMKLDQ